MKLTSGTLAKYNEGIIANNRSWSVRIKYYKDGSWRTLSNAKTASLTMSDYTIDGKNITMGSVVGGKLEFKVKDISGTEFENGTKVKFDLKLDSSSVTLTSKPYVVDEMNLLKKTDGLYDGTIMAYDITYLMNKTYIPTANELFANEIVEAIANKYNLGIDDSVYDAIYAVDGDDWTVFTIIPDFTEKQTLGYMAGCYGCYAYVTEDENIAFGWYTDGGKSIAKNDVYEDGATVSEASPRTYKMIESGTKETPLVYPSQAIGHSINFENPYITALQVEAIYNTKVANDKVTFSVAKVKYRGDPLNGGAGSILKARQANGQITMFVMKRTLYYDGGVYEVIESLGESESTISYKVASPTQQRIDRALSRMEEAIKNATDVITQTKGSVFELIPIDENDPSKGNSGWKLYSTQIGNNNLILANSSGIGFSNDGGETFGAAANYIDENGVGHINGNYITAGSISADKIVTSQLVVGDNVSPDLETLLNGIVDKANNSVTNVDVLYGKNQSTTTPPTNWSTSAPVWEEGYYIWTKTQTTVGGEITETEPVCITGAKGETGASGEAGATGDTGQGVSAIEEQYYLSTSSTTQSGGSWSTTQPSWSSGKYIWTRSKITWVNPSATTYTTPVLAKAINGANEKANSAETKANATDLILGGLTAKENNVVYIKGSSILAGSIGADQIGANAITANKLDVGTATKDNLFANYRFGTVSVGRALGWYAENGTLTPQKSGSVYNWATFSPSSTEVSGIYQKFYLKKRRYSMIARMNFYKLSSIESGAFVGYYLGNTVYGLPAPTASVSNLGGEIVLKWVFDYKGDEGFGNVGFAQKGFKFQSGGYISIAWTSLYEADDEPATGRWCSNIYWVDGNASRHLSNVNANTANVEDFQTTMSPFFVEPNGSLGVISGTLGAMEFTKKSAIFTSNVYNLNSLTGHTYSMIIDTPIGGVVEPDDFDKNYPSTMDLGFTPSITIRSFDDNSYSFFSHSGFECNNGVNSSAMTGSGVKTTGTLKCSNCDCTSKEKYKNSIAEKTSVLDKIKSSKIYEYRLNNEDKNHKRKTGFIVERETPEEIISDDGDGINLYSMASMNWKATQEILERLEALEEKAVNN